MSSAFKKDLRETLVQARQLQAEQDPFRVSEDPARFCESLGFKPTVYQSKLLHDTTQFIVARWSRQSGKSHCVAALILWLCLTNPGFSVVVLSPSMRQSKIIIRKLSSFLKRLPKFVAPKPLKTKIEFYNGSIVQAFPNNPETLRGEPGVHFVYIDEFNYVRDDSELYDAAIFTLGTTNGRFLATSTPGSRNSIFYAMCDPSIAAYTNVSRHHVSYRDALEPNGPLKKEILDQIRQQYEKTDPWRWTREMEAEFAEDEDSYLSMSTITGCVDPNLEPITDDFFLIPATTPG